MKKINTFWSWFQENNQTIKNLINETPKNQKHITFWINKNLSYYSREIDFIIVFPKKENSKTEFIITANGNPDYYNHIINLIDNAPRLRTWKFTAFIESTERISEIMNGLDETYIFHEITLKASELKFLTLEYNEESQKLDIIVFLKNYNIYCETKTLQQAIFIIMQDLLRKESSFQNISFVQLAQLPENEENLIQLCDLQIYLKS